MNTFGSALVIDDAADAAEMLRMWLEKSGWNVKICRDRAEAAGMLQRENFKLILLDYMMNGMSIEEFVPIVRDLNPAAKLMLLSGHASVFEVASTLGIGIALCKPFDEDFLISNVNRMFSNGKRRPSSSIMRPADV